MHVRVETNGTEMGSGTMRKLHLSAHLLSEMISLVKLCQVDFQGATLHKTYADLSPST